MGASDKNIAKYISLHTALIPAARILLLKSHFSATISPYASQQRAHLRAPPDPQSPRRLPRHPSAPAYPHLSLLKRWDKLRRALTDKPATGKVEPVGIAQRPMR
ncbi:hypothetical protein BU23DRAFT_557404 [Bimuria novae-zelandiae CBS 107.79]|uniref:Uncharacterized protein n=1 Tax=Bimuria novae-zelandiae CBS 107.79 TaxID=1447943 RepID=A0A6A5V903_9PLEO|nr:hypothetical protein BU23DRAFT_557404 [Bimuria novae-zelandiae CBS 107.79]